MVRRTALAVCYLACREERPIARAGQKSQGMHQERFDRIHRGLTDERLDGYARLCRLPSGIGRMSYADDATLERILDRMSLRQGSRVLDLCCGNGFLGRWLAWRGIRVRYVGVDFSTQGLAVARERVPHGRFVEAGVRTFRDERGFDAVFAIEAALDGTLDDGLAESIARALRPGAIAALTLHAIDGSLGRRAAEAMRLLRRYGCHATWLDVTRSTRLHVALYCVAVLMDKTLPHDAAEGGYRESAIFLQAVRDGGFGYGVVFATPRRAR